MKRQYLETIKVTSTILSVLLFSLLLLFAIGEGIDFNEFTFNEIILFFFASVLWLGLLIGIRRRLLGGLMCVVGFVLFTGYELLISGSWFGGWFIYLLVIPGVLNLLIWFLQRGKAQIKGGR